MPGLRLKPEHVRRLCGVDATVCQMALEQAYAGQGLGLPTR